MSAVAGDWSRSAVMYQVYPRSFADADSDGVGDLPGLVARLPYIASLGVDGIWLTPFQRSPQVDQGYDVSDYCDVDPLFGTMADLDRLVAEAHARSLRVVVDLVPNHCSVEHPLFQQALAAAPGSPARELFHFAEGRGDGPPNNWQSVFGGPAWHRAAPGSATDRQWYLHMYTAQQPDWNWRNPAVADFFDGVIRFWLDLGVDGLRIDVAHGLYKSEGLPDVAEGVVVMDGLRSNVHAMDQEEVHGIYRRWRAIADRYEPQRILVGEVNLEPERVWRYVRPDELHQAFAFALLRAPWSASEWARIGERLEEAHRRSGAPVTWALENHDVARTVTRYGGGARGARRARAALVAMLGLPGSAYLYQGQELGLPEVDVPVDQRVDPAWQRSGLLRDGARIPLPWTAEPARTHGFSTGDAVPWLPVPPGWGELAVDRQERDPDSTLALVRRALGRRAELHAMGLLSGDDHARWAVGPGGSVRCDRGRLSVVVAMGDEPAPLPAGEVMLASGPQPRPGWLEPDTAAWLSTEEVPA
ncbi:alpha-amylase family glycosyl hydrolase [Georgenia sp. AZ-5]|uniref:alpha-amylase family glycosyl hydrolase n=1 Tax=Georgenia sp. AZ-5 TaxID=3367526 RepID=UPI003755239E